MTYTAVTAGSTAATGSASRTGYLGIAFGQQAVGEGVWGAGPEVKLNENSDFKRFIVAAWFLYGGFVLLNNSFVTVCRSFEN